ncbi:MAG: GGDEF domain-containing protein, partial [Candidatus Competibacteraceae bacterium]|nr:GGDEF domain-containing protein [Candidatus Competibacteraceae bacterium]
ALRGQLLAAMEVGGWPVTFSIGAVTFVRPVSDARVALETADGFMYQVKQRGKNDLLHRIW